jgi:predicted phage replisome organizer
MSDIHWIKLSTGIFDDEKIKLIESLPDADSVLVIWVKLLVLAGRLNEDGYIFLMDGVTYTDETLATVLNRPLNTVRLALSTFQKYGFIDANDSGIFIRNWAKYQNIEGMELIRAQNRNRKQLQRQRQTDQLLLPAGMSRDGHVTVTQQNRTDKDKNENREDKKEKENKIKFAESVLLFQEEFDKLVVQFGERGTQDWITKLSRYKKSKGKEYKSDYDTILNWEHRPYRNNGRKKNGNNNSDPDKFIRGKFAHMVHR